MLKALSMKDLKSDDCVDAGDALRDSGRASLRGGVGNDVKFRVTCCFSRFALGLSDISGNR